MAKPVKYDGAVIQEFAGRLYSEAQWVMIRWCVIASGVSFFAGAFLFRNMNSGAGVLAFATALFGGLIGAGYGRAKGFQLRLQAQQALCQAQIEVNTRSSVGRP